MRTSYEREIFLFLSLFRFFAFGVAVVLIQVVPLAAGETIDLQTYVLLTGIGIYSLFKVLGSLRWWQRDPMTYVMLWGDLVVCLLALLLTGGLESGFLLYSLLPIITASLLFEEGLALSTAIITSLTVASAHLVLSRWGDSFAWLMEGNTLPWLVLYVMTTLLITTSVYRTNRNIRQHIETDAVRDERRRIRHEIHDGIAQSLTYLNMKADTVVKSLSSANYVQATSNMDEVRQAIQEAYSDIRESIDQLNIDTPVVPFVSSLTSYVKEYQDRYSIQVHFAPPPANPRLPPAAELQLLRIAQEALTNVRKHARASEVWVQLANTPQHIEMTIRDNGQGFAYPYSPPESSYHGLTVMRERTESLGGGFTIFSSLGKGTEVRVVLPKERLSQK